MRTLHCSLGRQQVTDWLQIDMHLNAYSSQQAVLLANANKGICQQRQMSWLTKMCGAFSFFDAGSCIDGRLTSAWNWHALSFVPCPCLHRAPAHVDGVNVFRIQAEQLSGSQRSCRRGLSKAWACAGAPRLRRRRTTPSSKWQGSRPLTASGELASHALAAGAV